MKITGRALARALMLSAVLATTAVMPDGEASSTTTADSTSTVRAWEPAVTPTALTGRWGAAAAYHSGTSKVVLFGGCTSSNPCTTAVNDTWQFDGTTWTAGPAAPSTLTSRYGMAMARDEVSGQIVMFGGIRAGSSTPIAETFTFNGTSWTKRTTRVMAGAVWAAMAPDKTGRPVLFGGCRSVDSVTKKCTGYLDTTFRWTGTDWQPMCSATTAQCSPRPSARMANGQMARQKGGSNNLVLFGGATAADFFGDTWVWDSTKWASRTPVSRPADRGSGAAAPFDTSSGKVLLFGGGDSPSHLYGDTWIYDGTNWSGTNCDNALTCVPAPRATSAMALHEAAGEIVMFGGLTATNSTYNQTWTY